MPAYLFYISIYIYIYLSILCRSISPSIHPSICLHLSLSVYVYVCKSVYMYACVHIYIYTSVTYIHISYIYIYIHAYTYMLLKKESRSTMSRLKPVLIIQKALREPPWLQALAGAQETTQASSKGDPTVPSQSFGRIQKMEPPILDSNTPMV